MHNIARKNAMQHSVELHCYTEFNNTPIGLHVSGIHSSSEVEMDAYQHCTLDVFEGIR